MQSPQPMQNILYHKYLLIQKKKGRLKEIYFAQRLSLQRLTHNVFLTKSLLHQCLTYSSTQRSLHNVTLYALSFCDVWISQNISNLKFRPPLFQKTSVDQTETSTLHRCNIYAVTVWSFRTIEQRLHTNVPWIKCCINIPKYLKFV